MCLKRLQGIDRKIEILQQGSSTADQDNEKSCIKTLQFDAFRSNFKRACTFARDWLIRRVKSRITGP